MILMKDSKAEEIKHNITIDDAQWIAIAEYRQRNRQKGYKSNSDYIRESVRRALEEDIAEEEGRLTIVRHTVR